MTTRDVGILTTDAALVIRSWNDWLVRATGVRSNDAVGQPLSALAPGLEARGFLHRLQEVVSSGTVQVLSPTFHKFLIECAPQRPSAFFDRMQQHVTIGPLVESDGRTSGLVITIEDVTPRLDQEREIAQASARAGGFEAIASSLRDDDWRVRRATVEGLSRTPSPDLLNALIDELRRNHRNFSALSSALRLLATTEQHLTAPLASLLKDPDPDLRMQVALALGEQRDPAAAEPLLTALEDPDQNVRFHAIEALGRLRAPSAVDALASIAESGDFFLAFAALDALALIHDPRVSARLVRLLEKSDVREAVIDMLGTLGDVQVAPPLATVINRMPETAEIACRALTQIHERESARGPRRSQVPQLVRETVDADGRRHLVALLDRTATRRAALTVLGWLRDESLAPQFVRFVDGEERDVAIRALVGLGDGGVDHLLRCCRGDHAGAAAAVSALGETGSRRATAALLEMLDRGAQVGIAAAGALARLSDPDSFEGLLARAGHPDAALRQAVVGALNSIGHPDLPLKTAQLLGSENPLLRESGVKIAGYFGFAGVSADLVRLTRDPEESVRIAAIEHLPFVAVEAAAEQLIARMPEESARGRAAIVRSLAHYESPRATDALLAAMDDPDLWVRYYAARSLGGRDDERATDALLRAAHPSAPEPVRVAAVDALATRRGYTIDRVLLAACEESNADVATAALRALGERRTDASIAVLQREARGGAGPRASAAFEGLARDGSPQAIEILQWVSASTADAASARTCAAHLGHLARTGPHTAIAVDALLALSLVPGRLDAARQALLALPPQRVPDVAQALRQPSVDLRQRAVSVLGELRHPQATAHLVHALDDEEAVVREAAVAALAQLGARNVEDSFARLAAGDPSAAVRRAAADALASLGRRT